LAESVGKYELIRRLAIGGMAEVFLARGPVPGGGERELVVKRLLPHLAEDAKFLELFLSEARIAARLAHPNIVQLFDLGVDNGLPYLAMDYVDGPSLRHVLQRAAALSVGLPFALCARIVSQACEALAYAHELCDPNGRWLGLIHRDVSPENLLVSSAGQVKVVDFGIAKAAGMNPSKSASLRGKYSYMAPEQLKGRKRLDRRVDVYALGVVLYELLTGRKPYDATGEVAVMRAILFAPIVPASQRRPELPRPLEEILERALGKDRELRYPTCRDLQGDLEEYLRGTADDVSPPAIAALIRSLDAIPRTPSGAYFPPQEVAVKTDTSVTRDGDETPIAVAAASKPVWEMTPGSPESTRIAGRGAGAVVMAETRIQPVELTPSAPGTGPAEITVTRLMPPPSRPAKAARRSDRAPKLLVAAVTLGGTLALALAIRHELAAPAPSDPPGPAPIAAPAPAKAVPELSRSDFGVRSTPAADVWVDGQRVGPSPVWVEKHAPGEVRIEVRDAGGQFSKTMTFYLLPGDNGLKEVVVQSVPVEFQLPGRTRVLVDEREIGTSPFDPVVLPEGAHAVRLINRRLHREVQATLVVSPGRANIFKHDLAD